MAGGCLELTSALLSRSTAPLVGAPSNSYDDKDARGSRRACRLTQNGDMQARYRVGLSSRPMPLARCSNSGWGRRGHLRDSVRGRSI